MEEKEFLLTQEGYNKLEKQLEYLKTEKRAEISERIKVALGFGDLSENSEYDEAKNEQSILEARIAELDKMLKSAKIIDSVSTTSVGLGTSVTLYDFDFNEEIKYHIVATNEIDPSLCRISLESPVGKALFGRKIGDEIQVNIPDGISKYKILSIEKSM